MCGDGIDLPLRAADMPTPAARMLGAEARVYVKVPGGLEPLVVGERAEVERWLRACLDGLERFKDTVDMRWERT